MKRKLTFEEIGRNYHTIDNDPYNFEDYPGIDIEMYPMGSGTYAKVTVDDDDSLSAPGKLFKFEEEAKAYTRKYAEKAHVKLMNSNTVVEQARHRWKSFVDIFQII
jgi:hypothetical protein